jgi:hypothetical protein
MGNVYTAVIPKTASWTSDASGNASVTIPAVNGMILVVEFVPGKGAVQPTNNYSATLLAASGYDLLLGKGAASLSNLTPTRIIPAAGTTDANTLSGVAVAEDVTLNISGAGSGKSGTVTILTR